MTDDAESHAYLIAELAEKQVAFPVGSVSEMVRSVELARLPGAPKAIEGALNLRGTIVPVIDLRSALDLEPRANAPSDFLVVLELRQRMAAVRVDDVLDVTIILPGEIAEAAALSPALASIQSMSGIVAHAKGALVIFDPNAFLSAAEQRAIDTALASA